MIENYFWQKILMTGFSLSKKGNSMFLRTLVLAGKIDQLLIIFDGYHHSVFLLFIPP